MPVNSRTLPVNNVSPPPVLDTLRIDDIPNIYKVLIVGAESTGKTTLCQDLAMHFNTQWTAEYMRPYLQHKWDTTQKSCEWEDLLPIAKGQVALENQQARLAHRYLFCDTALFELMVYAYWYYGKCPSAIEEAALHHQYDLILLTEVDVPWVADDLRDAPHQRHEISQAFEQALITHNKPFKKIGGSRQQRVATVANWLAGFN